MEEYIEETIEETVEEEIVVDTPTQESSEPVPEFIPDQEQNEPSENELLMEYIRQELTKNAENKENIEESEEVSEISALESSQQDYSDILSELGAIKNELIYQTAIYDDYSNNNNIQSSVSDISLNNATLLLIFIAILFSTVVNFSRRIF